MGICHLIMVHVASILVFFVFIGSISAIPPSKQSKNPSCPDLTNWTQGKKQKDYSNKPSGVKVYKYLTATSSSVSYADADAQCEYEFGGYVVSANIIDEDQNDYVFGNDSPLNTKNEYWFNSFLSTLGIDGKNGGGCDGIHWCSQSWRRCKQNEGGQQCNPYGSDQEFNKHFSHPAWDDNWKRCEGGDSTGRNDCPCSAYQLTQKPTTISVFAEKYMPAFVYQDGSKTKWGCETK